MLDCTQLVSLVNVLGVSTNPGDTALQVIPDPAVSNATTFNTAA